MNKKIVEILDSNWIKFHFGSIFSDYNTSSYGKKNDKGILGEVEYLDGVQKFVEGLLISQDNKNEIIELIKRLKNSYSNASISSGRAAELENQLSSSTEIFRLFINAIKKEIEKRKEQDEG